MRRSLSATTVVICCFLSSCQATQNHKMLSPTTSVKAEARPASEKCESPRQPSFQEALKNIEANRVSAGIERTVDSNCGAEEQARDIDPKAMLSEGAKAKPAR